ncbi:putative VQ motif-containing protein [Helianthus debilis subsp. tardiflorus]
MDSGNSSSGGDGSATAGDVHFNHIPILQPPPSNFFNPSSFSHPPNPNPNSIYTLNYPNSIHTNSNLIHDPNPVDHLVDNDDPNPNFGPEKLGVTTKNPKKRTRASRRAPTTVMTTDTANFRQMVQEFTGIPAVPFSSSAYSSRRDLYAGSTEPMAVPMQQPVRPSAHKIVQLQPYLNSVTASGSNFHLPPSESHMFTKQSLSLQNLQNQMFPFQSVSQSLQTTVSQQFDNNNNNINNNDQRLEPLSGFVGSSSANLKRWRGESENLLNYEGVNGNSQNVVVSSSDGEQHQLGGNEDTWSF